MKRYALTADGKITVCVAKEDRIGRGRCNHIAHQKDGESTEDFLERALKIAEGEDTGWSFEDIAAYASSENVDEKFKVAASLASIGVPITIIGGFGIAAHAELSNSSVTERPTKDIDANWWAPMDVESFAYNVVNKMESEGWSVSAKHTAGKDSVRFLISKDEGAVTQVDMVKSPSVEDSAVPPIKSILKEKIALKLALPDRRFKDLVDSINAIMIAYPGGVEKKEIAAMIDPALGAAFLSKANVEDTMEQALKFKPKELNGMTMPDYAESFIRLVEGALDSELPDGAKFTGIGWFK